MKFKILLLAPLLYVCSISPVQAEPCASSLNLEQTIEAADVIAVIRLEKTEKANDPETGYIHHIAVIKKILKGMPMASKVRIRADQGTCGDGINLRQGETSLVFLSQKKAAYAAVNGACAIRKFTIKDNNVYMIDKTMLPLEDFSRHYLPMQNHND